MKTSCQWCHNNRQKMPDLSEPTDLHIRAKRQVYNSKFTLQARMKYNEFIRLHSENVIMPINTGSLFIRLYTCSDLKDYITNNINLESK